MLRKEIKKTKAMQFLENNLTVVGDSFEFTKKTFRSLSNMFINNNSIDENSYKLYTDILEGIGSASNYKIEANAYERNFFNLNDDDSCMDNINESIENTRRMNV